MTPDPGNGRADPDDPDEGGSEPADRTRLAWTRTAIAFAAIGGAMLKSSPAGGAIVLALSVPVWAAVRGTGRAGGASRRGLRLVMATVVLVAAVAFIIALTGHQPGSIDELFRGR